MPVPVPVPRPRIVASAARRTATTTRRARRRPLRVCVVSWPPPARSRSARTANSAGTTSSTHPSSRAHNPFRSRPRRAKASRMSHRATMRRRARWPHPSDRSRRPRGTRGAPCTRTSRPLTSTPWTGPESAVRSTSLKGSRELGRPCPLRTRPAYLHRETRPMEHVERPLLGGGESVDQDVAFGAGEAAPQEDGGCLLVSCPQHGRSPRVPKYPAPPGVTFHYVEAVAPATQRERHVLGARAAQPCLHLGHNFQVPFVAIPTGQRAWDGPAVYLALHLGRRVHGQSGQEITAKGPRVRRGLDHALGGAGGVTPGRFEQPPSHSPALEPGWTNSMDSPQKSPRRTDSATPTTCPSDTATHAPGPLCCTKRACPARLASNWTSLGGGEAGGEPLLPARRRQPRSRPSPPRRRRWPWGARPTPQRCRWRRAGEVRPWSHADTPSAWPALRPSPRRTQAPSGDGHVLPNSNENRESAELHRTATGSSSTVTRT